MSAFVKFITASEKTIVKVAVSPTLKAESLKVIDSKVGTVVSITISLLYPKDPSAPGSANTKFASFPAKSFIVPSSKSKIQYQYNLNHLTYLLLEWI
jgi:uncharacterized protein YggU (UPF0235/DUF167 family)